MWNKIRQRVRPRGFLQKVRREMRQLRLGGERFYDPRVQSEEPAIFVGGCGRSGTTLFREILNRHPRICVGPETAMFGLPFDPENIAPYWEVDERRLWELSRECGHVVRFAERFMDDFRRREGKARWAEKSPNNVWALPSILRWFPRGKFLHLIRDGRDVACSLRHHPSQRVKRGRLVPNKVSNPISSCAARWQRDVALGRSYRGHPRCHEVRYEDLVRDPEGETRRVCEFLEEDFVPEMLDPGSADAPGMSVGRLVNNPNAGQPVSDRSMGRWRSDLSAREREVFVDIAGELLIATGYATDHSWVHEGESG